MIDEWRKELDDYEKEFLQRVYDYLKENNEWPNSLKLFVELWEKGDIYKSSVKIGSEFIQLGHPSNKEDTCKLSIYGIALCKDSNKDLQTFIKMIQLGKEKFLSNPINCEITSEEIQNKYSLSKDDIWRIFMINKVGYSIFHGYSWDKDKKSFNIHVGYDILKYENIKTFEDYIKLNLKNLPVRFGGKSKPSRDDVYYRYYDMEELWEYEGDEEISELMEIDRDFEEGYVFILMPISEDYELKQVNKKIKEVCQEFDLRAQRVDDFQDSGSITKEILVNIKRAEFVIIDLSEERPNVYYELGFAHGKGISPYNLILIAKEGSKLHFDIRNFRVIQYKDPDDLEDKLRTRFQSIFDTQ